MALLTSQMLMVRNSPGSGIVIATEFVRDVSICRSKLIRAKSESKSAVRMYNVTFEAMIDTQFCLG